MKSNFLTIVFASSILSVAGCFEPFPEVEGATPSVPVKTLVPPDVKILNLVWTPISGGSCGYNTANTALVRHGVDLEFNPALPSNPQLAPCSQTGSLENFACNYQSGEISLTETERTWKQWALQFTPKLDDAQAVSKTRRFNSVSLSLVPKSSTRPDRLLTISNSADDVTVINSTASNAPSIWVPAEKIANGRLELNLASLCFNEKSNTAPALSKFSLADVKLVPIGP